MYKISISNCLVSVKFRYFISIVSVSKILGVVAAWSSITGASATLSVEEVEVAGTHFLRHRFYKLIRPFEVPLGEYRRRHFQFGVDSAAVVRMNGLINSIHQFS